MAEIKDTNIQKEEPNLYKQSVKGGVWVFASKILEIVKILLIANLFHLEELGLLSISYMLVALLRQFSESGFQAALIRSKDQLSSDDLDTTWAAGIVRGMTLFLILFFAAPLFVTMIDKTPLQKISPEKIPLAIAVIRVIGLCFLIEGFQNIGVIYFRKELQFRKLFHLSVIGTASDFVLTVVLVLVFRSIWGVIIARIAVALITCGYSYILSSYRPRFRFHFSRAKGLWKFGKWIFGQQIMGYCMTEGDDFFVLFYLGLPFLALYRYAFRFASMPATHVTYVISQVSFPAYSKIQHDLPRLREAYLKVLKLTALFSIPMAFLIFTLGPDFVRLCLPEHMAPMILVLQILAFKGLMGSLAATWSPLFRAIGKPEKTTYLMSIGLVVLCVTIYPFTRMWGIAGTALSTLLIGIVSCPYGYYTICRELKCRISAILKLYLIPVISSTVMSLGLALIKRLGVAQTGYILFAVLGVTAIAVYIISLWTLDRFLKFGIREIVIEQISQILKPIRQWKTGFFMKR